MRAWLGAWVAVALLAGSRPAPAFPGFVLAKDAAPRAVRSTSVVIVQHAGYSVVTVMTELEGPLLPFALVLPVPSDVTPARLRTVRRAVLGRVESVSAPRLHAFYEQDPCNADNVEQAWDEHLKPAGRGFLTPESIPPADRHYAVSNAINAPVEPSFKEAESEFRYEVLPFESARALAAAVLRRGYRAEAQSFAALEASSGPKPKILLAEVVPTRVELAAGDRIQLGGIRYWSREPVLTLPEGLGPSPGAGREDVFVYVLDRKERYAVLNVPNVVLPTNVRVEPRAADRLAGVYAALFDMALAKTPGGVAVEYAWPTSGCGEPCPDAPLGADELLTLGGDVLEANTTTATERAPDPGTEPVLERERFESRLAELMPAERPAAQREHAAERREIARRQALAARHTYVLTRLHERHDASRPARDLRLAPAPPLAGGTGVPRGVVAEWAAPPASPPENALQMRFVALYPWQRAVACSEPKRGVWGKRWASEARVSRAVPLALGLGAVRAERELLSEVLVRDVPALGLRARPEPSVATTATVPAASATPSTPARQGGCAVTRTAPTGGTVGLLAWLAAGVWLALVTASAFTRRAVRRRVPR
jgi:hypothetical protein